MSRDVATNQDLHRSHKEYHLAIYSSLLIKETEPSGCLHQTEKRAPEKVPLMEWWDGVSYLGCLDYLLYDRTKIFIWLDGSLKAIR